MSQSLHRSKTFTEIVIAHQQREGFLATSAEMIAETHSRFDSRLSDRGTEEKVPDYVLAECRIGHGYARLGSELLAVRGPVDHLAGEPVLPRRPASTQKMEGGAE